MTEREPIGDAHEDAGIDLGQERANRSARHLAVVAEVGRAVTSSLDLRTLLRVLVDLLKKRFGFYGVNVWLLPDEKDVVQLQTGYSPQGEDLGKLDFQISMDTPTSITQVCETGDHCLVEDIEKVENIPAGTFPEEYFPLRDRYPAARAQLVLPLRVAWKTIGALEILSDQAGAFQDQDVILLRSLADQATIAIRNATLYQAEYSRRRLAETLYQIGQALSTTIDLDEVLDLILAQLDEIVPTDRAKLLLLDDGQLNLVAARGFPQEISPLQLSVPAMEEEVFEQIFSSQRPFTITDLLHRPFWQQLEGLPPARSWLGVPLIRSSEVIGILSLTRQSVNPYSVSEVTLASTFAGQAALALENARLYDNLARFNQQLEEMVHERTEELRQAYAQLERLDRTKSDFIRVTSHELRTPVTVLRGYSEMLMQEETITGEPGMLQMVEGIHSGAARMHEIVNGMLDVVKIDSSALDLSTKPLSVSFLVKNVTSTYESALKRRRLGLTIEGLNDLPAIDADHVALNKVFSHLVGNAIKYTPDGGQITVTGQILELEGDETEDGYVEIVVSDTGIGIDPDHVDLIFTKFYQTGEVALHSTGNTKFKGGGPGLGLPIARGIIQAHQGQLWVESPGYDEEACPGSQFHVVLPVRQPAASA